MALETTLSQLGPAGSNPKGAAADGIWPLLLPGAADVLVVGAPDPLLLAALETHARSVHIQAAGAGAVLARVRAPSSPATCEVTWSPRTTASGADVIVLPDPADWATWALTPRAQLVCVLAPLRGTLAGRLPPALLTRNDTMVIELRGTRLVAATPVRGGDPVGAPGPEATHRRGLLLSPSWADITRPSRQIRTALRAAGETTDHRWWLQDRGRYRTNKVIIDLWSDDPGQVPLLAKAVRDPADGQRLDTEHAILTQLAQRPASRGRVPTPVTTGHHDGRPFIIQRRMDGRPLRDLDGDAADATVRDGADWLVELGVATAHRARQRDIADLGRLLDRFTAMCRPSPRTAAFLDAQLRLLEQDLGRLPLVVAHGDAGTWNLRRLPDGRAAFLDWESGERHGLPLWDLFYLVRTHAAWLGRRQGIHDSVAAYARLVVRSSALSRLQADASTRFCRATGMPERLAAPLLHLCWAHRATKEATRRSPRRSTYLRLLASSIEGPMPAGLPGTAAAQPTRT